MADAEVWIVRTMAAEAALLSLVRELTTIDDTAPELLVQALERALKTLADVERGRPESSERLLAVHRETALLLNKLIEHARNASRRRP